MPPSAIVLLGAGVDIRKVRGIRVVDSIEQVPWSLRPFPGDVNHEMTFFQAAGDTME